MRVLFILFVLLCISLNPLHSQEVLPRYMTPAEEAIWPAYIQQKRKEALRGIPEPPPGRVRTMAEWEEIQALILTWTNSYSAIQREIVRHAVNECKVLILTSNPSQVSNLLTQANIPLDSVEFINAPYNTIWVRDFGPWAIYYNDVDSLWLADWVYNRPRPQDDAVPSVIADYMGLPIYTATSGENYWVHTGGNNLPDGMNTTFSSMLVLEENPESTEAQIDEIAKKFLGTTPYIKFPTLPFDGIHHLDMHMRVIDEETILVGEYPQGVSDGPQIESNIQYLLDEHVTAFGNRYNIIRLPMPPDGQGRYPSQGGNYRTYTNSIFLNKTILVPTYEERYDTVALRIYRENLPGYNVVGINCNSIIPSLGALHCITKTVGVSEPLWIAHQRLRDSHDESLSYSVNAIIKHRSGINHAEVYYRTKGEDGYVSVVMTLVDSVEQIWTAVIPPFPEGAEIQYYIHAVANNGKEQVRPIVAPEGYFKFRVIGEQVNTLPFVEVLSPANGQIFDIGEGLITLSFNAWDADGTIDSATIYIQGEPIAGFSEPPFTFDWAFTSAGSYDLVVEVIDNQGAIAQSDTVYFIIEGVSSVDGEADALHGLTIYPNPASDRIWIELNNHISNQPDITLYDITGRVLKSALQQSDNTFSIDISDLTPGMYWLQVKSNEAIRVSKMVKR